MLNDTETILLVNKNKVFSNFVLNYGVTIFLFLLFIVNGIDIGIMEVKFNATHSIEKYGMD